ncbi:MAG: cation:proton antiporter [Thermoguttaceae bacterium]
MDFWGLLLEIVILLAVSLVLGGLLSRFGQSPLVGYLLAGMLLGGPRSLQIIGSEHSIQAIAELGVALLLFSLGLEFSWPRLKALGGATLASGVIQVVVTAAAAAAVGLSFGLGIAEAVAVGSMLSLSSTAAVFRVLIDRGESDSLHGRNSVGILLVQDMAVVPLAILVAVLGKGGSAGEIGFAVLQIVGQAAALIVFLYLFLNKIAVRALATLSLEQNRELTVLLAVVVGLGSTWAAHHAGLSPALGAFVAGMFLGSSPFAAQLRADVASLRVVLLTLFFGAVGMVADPLWILRNFWFVFFVGLLIVVGKTIIIWAILRAMGRTGRTSLATGLCLAQVGEFAFVLDKSGATGGVVTEHTEMVVVSSAILTLLFTPYLVQVAPRLATWVAQRTRRAGADDEGRPAARHLMHHAVIVGFGPAGQAVGRALAGTDTPVLVLDVNPAARKIADAMGLESQVGDASQIDVLEHAHVQAARLVVITLPAHRPALTVMEHVRALAPHAPVIVRSRHQVHWGEFEAAGADVIVGDEEEVGTRLAEKVMAQVDGFREGER